MTNLVGITGRKRHGKDTLYKVSLAPRLFDRLAFADSIKAITLAEHLVDIAPGGSALNALKATEGAVGASPRAGIDVELLNARLQALWGYYYQYFGAEKDADVRKRLQEMGTDIVKELLDPGYWLSMVLKEAHQRIRGGDPVTITDVRVPNEAKAVQGDRDWMLQHYADLKSQGRPTLPHIEWMLTHYDGEYNTRLNVPGVLPRQPGVILKVYRPGLPDNDTHATEVGVDLIAADATITNNGKAELKAEADRVLDRLGIHDPLREPALA